MGDSSTGAAIDSGRRHLLGAVAAAGLPAWGQAAPPLRRVGIVGAGMAGIAAAWLLDGACEVSLFEARPAIGGNVSTVQVVVDGQPYAVDVGAQYFHPGPYPAYVQLLETLGLYPVGSHAFVASITLADPAEARPRFVSPVLPGRVWPLVAPWNAAGVQAFATAFRAAARREQLNAPWSLTLGEWLPTLGLSPAQWEGMLLPWAASLNSGDVEQSRSLSARAAMAFAARALPPKPTDPTVYHVLDAGMIEPLQRMAAQFTTVALHTATPVVAVARGANGGFVVQPQAGAPVAVDDLVFAASGEPTLALLAGIAGTGLQRAALQGIEFYDARLAIHTGADFASPVPAQRSFLNCSVEGGFCEASMDLARVLKPAPGQPVPALWKSWVSHRASPPGTLHEASFRHVLPSAASVQAQGALRALQGAGGVWFAGGYTEHFDAQETALLSAMDVAAGLNPAGARGAALRRRARPPQNTV